jgi:hypothetical protein
MIATNQNFIHEEIKSGLNLVNACYHSIQNLLACLLSKSLYIIIYKTITLPPVLNVCEILSLTLGEKHRLRIFENRVLRRIFRSKRDKVTTDWRRICNKELHNLHTSLNIIKKSNQRDEIEGSRSMLEKHEKCIQNFKNFKGRDHLEDLGVDRRIILE